MLDGAAEQIIDSTPMLGAAATQDTVRLVCHGFRKLIDAVKAADQDADEKLDDGLEFDYDRPGEKPDGRWREKTERERMLTRVAEDAERALKAVEQTDRPLDDDAVKAAHDLLPELIGQDFDIDQDSVPRLHRATRSDRIISTVDPEMRHGRKSNAQRFDGYKLHAAATNDPEPLITAVHMSPAGEQDGPQAKHLIDSRATRTPSGADPWRHRLWQRPSPSNLSIRGLVRRRCSLGPGSRSACRPAWRAGARVHDPDDHRPPPVIQQSEHPAQRRRAAGSRTPLLQASSSALSQ